MDNENTIQLPRYSISIKQSARGGWYCDECKVRANEPIDMTTQLEEAIALVKKKLEELNKQ